MLTKEVNTKHHFYPYANKKKYIINTLNTLLTLVPMLKKEIYYYHNILKSDPHDVF